MITGAHTIIHATDAAAARAFFRDVLGLPNVDAGDGWLIFKSPPAEVAVHPADPLDSGHIQLYLMCDDLEATIAELRAKGVEFVDGITQAGWGRIITLEVPGAGPLGLYQPYHPVAHNLV
ncbi:VOC family protein [Nocardia sp. NPDC050406]|uniref:VOC family protein n=1 Tax=Nocardia sp. NPDC050406 TaxID=3364318 RepID=UPI00378B62FE